METKKRRHHYVFQAYLDSWVTGNQLWCLRDNAKIFNTSTLNVAQERDFYRLKPLNNDEIKFYELMISHYPENVQAALNEHLLAYLQPAEWNKQIETLRTICNLKYKNNIPPEITNQLNRMETIIDIATNNIDENYHSEIEGEAVDWLNQLKSKSTDFYYCKKEDRILGTPYDDDQFHFLYFICVQYYRTKAIKEHWISKFKKTLNDSKFDNLFDTLGISRDNINLENLVPHIFWEFQNLLAYNLRDKNTHLTLLINNTNTPFITSDQPVINLKADYKNQESHPDELILYYPISPNIAITINDDNNENALELSSKKVSELNKSLLEASNHDIYSNSKNILQQIQKPLITE